MKDSNIALINMACKSLGGQSQLDFILKIIEESEKEILKESFKEVRDWDDHHAYYDPDRDDNFNAIEEKYT